MSDEIFSSTGNIGREVRQDNRLYENADLYGVVFEAVAERFQDLLDDPRGPAENISRWVLRGVVGDETMSAIQADYEGLKQNLEVALPLAELGRPGWLIYLAQNAPERGIGLASTEEILRETTAYLLQDQTPAQLVHGTIDRGFEIRTRPRDNDAERLGQALWGPGFGWSDEEIEAFISQFHPEQNQSQPFFAGLYAGGLLVGAAMAETLKLPTPNGRLPLVESTEWYMYEDYRGQGLMPGVVAALNAQIAYSFRHAKHPLVYAECNYSSRSDRAGHVAGFRIPSRFANQILMQHVTVDDDIGPKGLRDFSFMYLPRAIFHSLYGYNARQVDDIMHTIQQEA